MREIHSLISKDSLSCFFSTTTKEKRFPNIVGLKMTKFRSVLVSDILFSIFNKGQILELILVLTLLQLQLLVLKMYIVLSVKQTFYFLIIKNIYYFLNQFEI